MKTIYFSADINMLEEFKARDEDKMSLSFDDLQTLKRWIQKIDIAYILVADYDSVAKDINKMISSNSLPQNVVVLERVPSVMTGKMLVSHGVKAYGNSRMLLHHYKQMIKTVSDGNIWTYPELTASLGGHIKKSSISKDAKKFLKQRLTKQERKVVYLILEGFVNDAIASRLEISTRTVKAHISSVFEKLHVNDRVSLILLLK